MFGHRVVKLMSSDGEVGSSAVMVVCGIFFGEATVS